MTVTGNAYGGGDGRLIRHVSFKEDSSASRSPAPSSMVSYSSGVDFEAQKKRCRPRCNRCCAWISVLIGVLILIALVFSIAFYSFLVSNMPNFYLNSIQVNTMNVTKDKNGDSTLTADVAVKFNVSNPNGRISFSYGPSTAEVTIDGVYIGWSHAAAFHQKINSTAKLELRSHGERLAIEEADGDDLVSRSMLHNLTVDVGLLGYIEYRVGKDKISGCPFKVTCLQAPQTVLDSGVGVQCNVKMSPLRI